MPDSFYQCRIRYLPVGLNREANEYPLSVGFCGLPVNAPLKKQEHGCCTARKLWVSIPAAGFIQAVRFMPHTGTEASPIFLLQQRPKCRIVAAPVAAGAIPTDKAPLNTVIQPEYVEIGIFNGQHFPTVQLVTGGGKVATGSPCSLSARIRCLHGNFRQGFSGADRLLAPLAKQHGSHQQQVTTWMIEHSRTRYVAAALFQPLSLRYTLLPLKSCIPMRRILLLLPLLLAACSSPAVIQSPYPQNPAVSDGQGHPRDSTTFYFPAADSLVLPVYKRTATNSKLELIPVPGPLYCTSELVFSSYCLTYFEAPVLSNYYLKTDIYRFFWNRSFARPVLLTLQHKGDILNIRTQILDKEPGFTEYSLPTSSIANPTPEEKGQLQALNDKLLADSVWLQKARLGKRRAAIIKSEETVTPVTQAQWQQFQHLLAQCKFEQLHPCGTGILTSTDGNYWLLESHQASGYYMVLRRSPIKKDRFRQACEYLLDLSSARKEERY